MIMGLLVLVLKTRDLILSLIDVILVNLTRVKVLYSELNKFKDWIEIRT